MRRSGVFPQHCRWHTLSNKTNVLLLLRVSCTCNARNPPVRGLIHLVAREPQGLQHSTLTSHHHCHHHHVFSSPCVLPIAPCPPPALRSSLCSTGPAVLLRHLPHHPAVRPCDSGRPPLQPEVRTADEASQCCLRRLKDAAAARSAYGGRSVTKLLEAPKRYRCSQKCVQRAKRHKAA